MFVDLENFVFFNSGDKNLPRWGIVIEKYVIILLLFFALETMKVNIPAVVSISSSYSLTGFSVLHTVLTKF